MRPESQAFSDWICSFKDLARTSGEAFPGLVNAYDLFYADSKCKRWCDGIPAWLAEPVDQEDPWHRKPIERSGDLWPTTGKLASRRQME